MRGAPGVWGGRVVGVVVVFFFSSRRRHTRFDCDWSSDVCSSDLISTRATLPRAASSVNTNAVLCPTNRGGVVTDTTPRTDWRQPRYDTEPMAARSTSRTTTSQAFERDRLGTRTE